MSVAPGQEPSKAAPSPEVFGTVTGQVLCADTQGPARLAYISFIPIPAASPGKAAPALDLFQTAQPPMQTDMTGHFSQPKLKPGRYYVNANLNGYLIPSIQFTPEMLQTPSPETQKRLREELTEVSVQPNRSTEVQLTLVRGASLSGTVLYDDGTPAIGMSVQLLGKSATGKDATGKSAHEAFTNAGMTGTFGATTDEHGRFDLTSVSAGEYVVLADLQLTRQVESDEQLVNGRKFRAFFTQSAFSLPIYFGDVLRLQDAVPLTLGQSESRSGLVISVPLSKLHQVSGTLIARDGHALNGGTVHLRDRNDDSIFLSVDVSSENGRFVFNYTPEGSYTLAVEDARDLAAPDASTASRDLPWLVKGKTLRKYGSMRQPLLVEGEKDDLVLAVPDETQDATAAPTAAKP
ncbi:MAG: carboxypeptidase-like regulatory domain-containing protein [Janthinobacterium lividum]